MSTSQADGPRARWLAQGRSYWASRPGQALLTAQTACLGPLLEARQDAHGLELGTGASVLELPGIAGPAHRLQWAPSRGMAVDPATLICSPETLALPDDCLDLVVLHHLLEYADRPRQVLAEAARVTRSSGLLLIFGFQPLGLATLAWRLGKHRAGSWPASGRWVTPGRLRGWLECVDFRVERVDYCAFGLPGRAGRCQERREALCRRYNLPLGISYVIRAHRQRHQAPVQRLRFGLQAPPGTRPMGISRGRAASSNRDAASAQHSPQTFSPQTSSRYKESER